jgi:hypothetical protein
MRFSPRPDRRLVSAVTLAVLSGFGLAGLGLAALGGRAEAAGPRNPYSSFNLSGINYGAQQWDRAQREGRSVWPYFNTPVRNSSRGSGVSVGGFVGGGGGAGTIIQRGSYQRPARGFRRFRR